MSNKDKKDIMDDAKQLQGGDSGEMDEDEDDELGLEQHKNLIVETIVMLGNEIWRNFGQEEEIDDVSIFFQHGFYIQCFQMAYPEINFYSLLDGNDDMDEDPQKMAECIQAIIDLLATEILTFDMSHIKGEEIVSGNPEHCINLLQILQQISAASMMQGESDEEGAAEQDENQRDSSQLQGDNDSEDDRSPQKYDKKQNQEENLDAEAKSHGDLKNQKQGSASKQIAQNRPGTGSGSAATPEGNLFGEDLNAEDADDQDKRQFLDNIGDLMQEEGLIGMDMGDNQNANLAAGPNEKKRANAAGASDSKSGPHSQNMNVRVDKVGDVIGQELDIEFDDEIQGNLHNLHGRASGGSSGQDEKLQVMNGQNVDMEYGQNDDEVVDPNDVNIDGIEDDWQMGEDDGSGGRELNRQTDNMADLPNNYGEEIDQLDMQDYGQNNVIIDDDEDGLGEMHDRLKNLDNQEDQYSQQIIDDQNLDMSDLQDMEDGGQDEMQGAKAARMLKERMAFQRPMSRQNLTFCYKNVQAYANKSQNIEDRNDKTDFFVQSVDYLINPAVLKKDQIVAETVGVMLADMADNMLEEEDEQDWEELKEIQDKLQNLMHECYALPRDAPSEGEKIREMAEYFDQQARRTTERFINIYHQSGQSLEVQLKDLKNRMPRTDQLRLFKSSAVYKTQSWREKLADGSPDEQAFILKEHAQEYFGDFNAYMRKKFKTTPFEFSGKVEQNLDYVAQKIQEITYAQKQSEPGQYCIPNMIQAEIRVGQPGQLAQAFDMLDQDENIQVVRVKNQLATGLKTCFVNLIWKDSILVQIGLAHGRKPVVQEANNFLFECVDSDSVEQLQAVILGYLEKLADRGEISVDEAGDGALMGKQGVEDEGQHYPGEDNVIDAEGENLDDLDQLDAQLQMDVNQDDMHDLNDQFDDLDPGLLKHAQQLGYNEEQIRQLQQQMLYGPADEGDLGDGAEQENEEEDGLYGEEQQPNEEGGQRKNQISDGDNDLEGQEIAEMLNGVHHDSNDQLSNEKGHPQKNQSKQILRGGQNIEDDDEEQQNNEKLQQERQSPFYGDEDDEMGREMAAKLKQLNEEGDNNNAYPGLDGEGDAEDAEDDEDDDDEDDQNIDFDKLNDQEKVILLQYFQDQYNNNPDQLPMPKEMIEQIFADNQSLIQKMQDQYEEEDGDLEDADAGAGQDGDDLNQGIDSSEIVVENTGERDPARESSPPDGMMMDVNGDMIIQGEKEIEEDNDEEGRNEQQQRLLAAGEINIQGGEQEIEVEEDDQLRQQMMALHQDNGDDDEYGDMDGMVEDEQQQRMLLQARGNENQYGAEQDGAEGQEGHGEEDEEEDPNQPQIFNPQYQLDEIQEIDQEDGGASNMMIQNINLSAAQQQQLNQQQQMFYQQQIPVVTKQQSFGKKAAKKKKPAAPLYSKKPPTIGHGGVIQRNAQSSRPLTAAASKKYKRSRIAINTINHDEQYMRNPMAKFGGLDMVSAGPNARSAQRKTNSMKRPQTAKTRKAVGSAVGKPQKRYNNYMSGGKIGLGAAAGPISSTPSNRNRATKVGVPQHAGSINSNLIVPQQSQIFTSFGLPQSAMSQRKAAASQTKKKNLSVYGSAQAAAALGKKKFPLRSTNQENIPKSGKSLLKKSQQQQLMQQQLQQQQLLQQNQQAQAQTQPQNLPQNLVEMPILSEEFLNQLNEEQLQALLEQQQQLMMLQQQSQQNQLGQPADQLPQQAEQTLPMGSTEDGQQVPVDFQGQLDGNDGLAAQPPETSEQMQLLQQQQMIQQQLIQNNLSKKVNVGSNLRGRGRTKAGGLYASAVARIPSNSSKNAGGFGSATRSKHGSKKRNQKTRSSMNIGGSLPLAGGPSIINVVNPATLANQVPKSKKLAAQIYGNSAAENMLNNLISQRKKLTANQQKKGAKKRSQPNQLGNAVVGQRSIQGQPRFDPFSQQQVDPNQQFNLQAQLQAQQAQYNIMQQQAYQEGQPQTANPQFQMQMGPDGQAQYVPLLQERTGTSESKKQKQAQAQDGADAGNIASNEGAGDQEDDEPDENQEDQEEADADEQDEQQDEDASDFQQQQKQQQMLALQHQQQQMQQQQLNAGQQSNILPLQGGQISSLADDLSTEQIIELLQNAADAQQNSGELGDTNFDENGEPIAQQNQQLPEEVQIQLQQVLQERMLQQQFLLQQQQIANAQGGVPIPQSHLPQNVQNLQALQTHANSQVPLVAGGALAGAGGMKDRVQSYQNICNILTESVSKAKERYKHLAPGLKKSQGGSPQRNVAPSNQVGSTSRSVPGVQKSDLVNIETDQRIKKQRQQFESLLKQYKLDMKVKEHKRKQDLRRAEKIAVRDEKIQAIKQKKFEEQMMNQQRSQMFKRNAQQVRLCKKVYKLASDLEKNKLLDEKKQYKEGEIRKHNQKKAMVATIENYYKDKISMLKDRIDTEKFERHIAQEAQKKALFQMKRELDEQKRKEVQRYIQLLQQEDDKYDLQNMDLGRLEGEIVKLYKK